MRILITGITGFVGSHFAEFALRHGLEVYGSCLWRSETENIDHIRDRITLIDCDLRDLSSVQSLLDTSAPDYPDVPDVVRAYWLLLQHGRAGGVYNICSGRAWSIQQVLDFLLNESTLRSIRVKEDPARLRPSDVPVLVGDASKLQKQTGWRPEIPFEQALRDLLEYWRGRCGARSG